MSEQTPLMYKSYYDIARLCVWGEPVETDQGPRRPRLVFSFRDGNPRITVYTTEIGNMISFPSEPLVFGGLLETLRGIVDAEPGSKEMITSEAPEYEDNKPTKRQRLVSTLYVGKSKEGLIYFSVIAEGKPKLIFTFRPSVFHKFLGEDKNPISDAVVSKRLALGLINTLTQVLANCVVQYTNEEYGFGGRKPYAIKSPNGGGSETTKNPIQDLDDLDL